MESRSEEKFFFNHCGIFNEIFRVDVLSEISTDVPMISNDDAEEGDRKEKEH